MQLQVTGPGRLHISRVRSRAVMPSETVLLFAKMKYVFFSNAKCLPLSIDIVCIPASLPLKEIQKKSKEN